MSQINLVRLVSSAVATAACSFAVLFFVGCDLGTYSERVQSTGNSLPVTNVSQESESDSDDKKAGAGNKKSDSKSKDPRSNEQEDSARSDPRDEAARAARSEAEARARAADEN